MLAAILVLTTIVVMLALVVGVLVGWVIKTYFEDHPPSTWTPHPELFNANGTLIPQTELLAIRVDGEIDYDELMEEGEED
jgi:hypothetical protein